MILQFMCLCLPRVLYIISHKNLKIGDNDELYFCDHVCLFFSFLQFAHCSTAETIYPIFKDTVYFANCFHIV